MKSFSLILIAVAMVLVVDAAEFSAQLGSAACLWRDVDPEKDVPAEVLGYASNYVITSFRADKAVRMASIGSAKKQRVNGWNYDLEILLDFTTCLSNMCQDDIYNTTTCPQESAVRCNLKVFHQPWSYTIKVYEYSCVL